MSSDTAANPANWQPANWQPPRQPAPPISPPAARRPQAPPPARRKPPVDNGQSATSTLAMPSMAALACICAGTAISGTVAGYGWLAYVVVVVVVMAAAGAALRALKVPGSLVWIGQLFVLLCLAVTLFTSSGVLVVLPGSTALHDLGQVLNQAGNDVQTGVPPVAADQAILCLTMLAMGLVAIAVDILVVTAKVPAVSGLILLCVYAVPASLDDALLPWWSFVLGAAAFTVMLAVDGVQRHQEWRGKLGLPAVATTGVAPATTAVTAVGLVVALFIGSTFTLIGTVGRIPGEGDGPAVGQLGIKPFTVLSGMLDQKATTELFDVKGLPPTPPYLQALTLDDYVPGQGWVRDTRMAPGVAADQHSLPAAPGQQTSDPKTKITISAVNWSDVWLPIYGMPANLQEISNDYRYDKDSGIVYSEKTRKPDSYVEQADLTVPTAGALRDAGSDYSQISRKYTRINGVDPKVENLARTITSNATDPFDQAQAIYNYFRAPGSGFTYSTDTGPKVTGDPLVDFLFHNKTGFCEQYASAMAVMLRSLGIPSRVGIGFTNGYTSGDHTVITSQDAHAWVEVYFPGNGWVTFDPTPLTDGRTQVPGFVNQTQDNGANEDGSRRNPDKPNGNPTTAPKAPIKTIPAPETTALAAGGGSTGIPVWQLATVLGLALAAAASTMLSRRGRAKAPDGGRVWSLVATIAWGLFAFFLVALLSWWLSVLVLVLGLAAAPSVIREWRRRRHHRLVVARGPGAADVAWHELLAESWDRGIELQRGDTLRVAANRMVREHGLDRDGQQSLRTLVGEVERSWYGAPPAPATQTPTAPAVVDSFDRVRGSLRRNAPMGFWSKVLPRSVLRPMRRRRDNRDDEDVS